MNRNIKLWIDDVRPSPEGYVWIKSVNVAIEYITWLESNYDWSGVSIDLIDMDHDAGDYAPLGGDYIRVLDWLEETNRNYPIRIHSQNPVGVQNMRAIIQRNNWKEVY